MKKLISFLVIVLMFLVHEVALAENPIQVSAIRLTGIDSYSGRNFSVIYAVAAAAGIGLSAEHITVNKIYRQSEPMKISGGAISLPNQAIQWTGAAKPNVILLVVHDSPTFIWTNGSSRALAVSKIFINQMRSQPSNFEFNFLSGL